MRGLYLFLGFALIRDVDGDNADFIAGQGCTAVGGQFLTAEQLQRAGPPARLVDGDDKLLVVRIFEKGFVLAEKNVTCRIREIICEGFAGDSAEV